MCSGSERVRARRRWSRAAVLALAGRCLALLVPVLLAGGCTMQHRKEPPAPMPPRAATGTAAADALRVCADPNNLPFSNRAGEGFENALATLVANELGKPVTYTWFPQRRGFVRNTLASGRCDVIMGVPVHYELAATTVPYYRSSYVFVTRADRHLDIDSFDDPRLARLRIGVHTIGDDYANVPPAQALAARGIVGNIRGYSIYGDYSRPDPPRDLIDAVAHGEVDVAIAWGPLAGYFARREHPPLAVRVARPTGLATAPMTFEIAMGVRRDDPALRAALDGVIARRRGDIDQLLRRYGVPLVASGPRGKPGNVAP
jgi:quinoprotein dehydrogenase-associated probable ABC transporter substrate-binding protein